jgi:dipeptidyl aminopeptidase/acylaminoacyl peptidase
MVHDGMFDIRSFYYSTDELWFPEHDIGGMPWNNATAYEEWNPAAPERVAKWQTPQMVIHGGRDYRIDQSQGLGAFTALQRQGIPSKFLYFPNEAHQVFDTRDQITWHHEVLAWIGRWTNTPVAREVATVTAGSSVLNQPRVRRSSFHSQQVAREPHRAAEFARQRSKRT